MKKFIRKLSLVPRGMRYKLMVAFCLMSLIPLWVIAYLFVNYLFPALDNIAYESMSILFTILIAFLGLVLARKLIEPVIDMALEAKIIAKGDFSHQIKVAGGDDEIGELGSAINQMIKHIRENLEELSSYGERTKEINFDIHKKVIALSNLLQVGDAITASKLNLKDILGLVSEKIAQTYESGYTILLMWQDDNEEAMRIVSSYNMPKESLKDLRIKKDESFLGRLILERRVCFIDSKNKQPADIKIVAEEYGLKNLVILPIMSHARLEGFLIVGNQLDRFVYKEDDIELYKIFARQVAIAVENDHLLRKTKELSITDDLTGLYNKKYITSRLDEEIKRAILFQRPCSFMVIGVDDFNKLQESYGGISVEKAVTRIAQLLKDNVTEVGKAARLELDMFALLLPEVNKRGAVRLAEDIRKKVEDGFAGKGGPDDIGKLTVSIGVSENPIDGTTPDELLVKAKKAVEVARSSGKNKVVSQMGG